VTPSRPAVVDVPAHRTAESRAGTSPATALRSRTASSHRATEAAYAGFDLTDRRSYTLFLQSHARALVAAESALGVIPGLPAWRPRVPFLRDDLAALGAVVPAPLPFWAVLDAGRGWGVLYVLEGSRIGSELLSGRVPHALPRSYLTAAHGPGEWQAFRAVLESALGEGDASMLERAVEGAVDCFTLFTTAASTGVAGPVPQLSGNKPR
jgi:heme oxygenase